MAAYRKRERVRTAPVESVVRGTNANLIREVCRLYAPSGTTIADVTWGKGAFWHKAPAGVTVTGSDLITAPEGRAYDFTDLPYADGEFDIVVLDPPYKPNGKTATTSDQYQLHTVSGMDDVKRLYIDGMSEAARVAGRQVWVKCQDMVHNGRQHDMMVSVVMHGYVLDLHLRDTFILVGNGSPASRWDTQHHARKRHSYLLVFDV
ncbi:hypothetical protein [Shimia aestuarii]|uniref:DNA methylase n=1 Tax=Shimia aestuarii TaxID=254406 RepID=A0A1I4P2Q8_9RHOB|nr:hypothetical protein [Shimia aestuarii]SFM21830.1 hypothetical protein SAMN04488042_10546 [Shimia aestuarii]